MGGQGSEKKSIKEGRKKKGKRKRKGEERTPGEGRKRRNEDGDVYASVRVVNSGFAGYGSRRADNRCVFRRDMGMACSPSFFYSRAWCVVSCKSCRSCIAINRDDLVRRMVMRHGMVVPAVV